ALPLIADAREGLNELRAALADFHVSSQYGEKISTLRAHWQRQYESVCSSDSNGDKLTQPEIIAAVNEFSDPRDVVVCAAGSLPGDLHKLWRARDPKSYHLEYGYSCMGYEVAGGLGVKMAAPEREVYVLVGDASYLMMATEIVTSIQEGLKLTIVLVDNHGFNSIGSLSRSLGTDGFGTLYRYRQHGSLGVDSEQSDDYLPVDLAANAESMG